MILTDTYNNFIPFFSQFLYTAGDADSVGKAMQINKKAKINNYFKTTIPTYAGTIVNVFTTE